MKSGPLARFRVVDLSRVLAGPFCGQMLADMGADVIKVEPPWGDDNRRWAPFNSEGESCNFMSVNRGKRSLTLNLKQDHDRGILDKLLETSDVLLHSFLPSTVEALNLSYEALHARFPKLVVCSLSGYGANGPLRDVRAYDVMLQAFTGAMSVTGEAGRPPVRAGISYIDLSTGIFAYSGILTALWSREKTNLGEHVRVSLLESGLALLGFHGISYLETGWVPQPAGSGMSYLFPYQAFRCSDAYVVTGANNEGQWKRFATAMGLGDLADDPRFATNTARLENRESLLPVLEQIFLTRTAAEWVEHLLKVDLPAQKIYTVAEAVQHEQTLANGMIHTIERPDRIPLRLMGLPFKVGDVRPSSSPPPDLGQHSAEILEELGIVAKEVSG